MSIPRTVKSSIWLSLLIAAITSPLLTTTAVANEPSTVDIVETRVGFGGLFKVGRWTPLSVTIRVNRPLQAELAIISPDPEGGLVTYEHAPVTISQPGKHQLNGRFKLGQMYSRVIVEIRDKSGTRVRQALTTQSDANRGMYRPLRQTARLVLTSGKPAGFEALGTATKQNTAVAHSSTHIIPIENLERLPQQHIELDSIDAVVLAGHYDVSAAQSLALKQWVQQGGHLVVSSGESYQQFAAGKLAEWIPMQFGTEQLSLRQLTGLESLANNAERLIIMGRLSIPTIKNTVGRVLVAEREHPVILQLPIGFGRVTYSAVDFDRPPLRGWKPLRIVSEKILGVDKGDQKTQSNRTPNRLSHSGITDLATQLNAAQELYPGLDRPSVWTTMGFIFVFLICIGPLDYLLVRRILKRPEWTWITFPTLAILASLLAVATARARNGNQILVNQLEIIDLALPVPDASSSETEPNRTMLRRQSWSTLYSPDSRRYDLQLQAAPLADANQPLGQVSSPLFWTGTPEDTFGGMYRGGGFDIGQAAYRFDVNKPQLINFPIRVWSTRSVHSMSWNDLPSGPINAKLNSHGVGQLAGELTQNLEHPLTDWILAFRSRVYLPREPLQPQIAFPPRGVDGEPDWEAIPQRELRAYLTNTTTRQVKSKKSVGVEFQTQQGVYDPESRELSHIVKMMTFYQAAGGRSYTRLTNGSLRELDLSKLLPLNCAILLGRTELTTTELQIDGDPITPRRHITYFRAVIPVEYDETQDVELPSFDE